MLHTLPNHPRIALVATALILGCLAPSGFCVASAQEAGAPTGPVFFYNATTEPLTIRGTSYVDTNGRQQRLDASWTVEPKRGAYLQVEAGGKGAPIRASRFDYQATTSAGTSGWYVDQLDGDGDLVVIFSPDDLDSHRRRAAGRPIETVARRRVAEVGEVVIRNSSPHRVAIVGVSFVDASGVVRAVPPGTWGLAPGDSSYLLLNGSRIRARRFDLILTANGQTSRWYIDAEDLAEGNLVFTVDAEILAKHRQIGVVPSRGPTEAQVQNAILKLIGATVAQGMATSGNAEGDGLIDIIVRGVSVLGRDALIESAVDDLFGTRPASERASVRRMIGLILDGRMTRADLARATTADAIQAAIKREAPDLAGAVDVVDFLARLQAARAQAH